MGKDDDDDLSVRRTPAENDDDWKHIWQSVDQARKAWWVVGPIHAVASNWKAILFAGVVIAWLSRDDIREAIAVIIGAGQ